MHDFCVPSKDTNIFTFQHTHTTLRKHFDVHIHIHHLLQKMKNICLLQHTRTDVHTFRVTVHICVLMNIILIWLCSSINSWAWNYVKNVRDNFGIQMRITFKIQAVYVLQASLQTFIRAAASKRKNDLVWTDRVSSQVLGNHMKLAGICSSILTHKLPSRNKLLTLFRPMETSKAQILVLSLHLHTLIEREINIGVCCRKGETEDESSP